MPDPVATSAIVCEHDKGNCPVCYQALESQGEVLAMAMQILHEDKRMHPDDAEKLSRACDEIGDDGAREWSWYVEAKP